LGNSGVVLHYTWHLYAGAALLAATIALLAIVKNGVIRRRLRFTLWTTLLYLVLHVAGQYVPSLDHFDPQIKSLEQLMLVLAIVSGAVSLINPWFRHGVPDRMPSILQDTLVVGIFFFVATVTLREQLGLTSAVGAAVIGFALQDTLGNAFAGLAIQIEKPFRVGHWITVGAFEGLVTEITWRATKLRTKAGNLVVVPNNIVSKEAINNYSEPEAPTRVFIEIGTSYDVPPNHVKAAINAALAQSTKVLKVPAPSVLFVDFGASALMFHVRFWIRDFSDDNEAKDEVRTFIYYELRRRNIEIPYPIQVEYSREESAGDPAAARDRTAALLAKIPVFAGLPADALQALAEGARSHEYAAGEAVVREGDAGASMFLVERGCVGISIRGAGKDVAVTEAGGYFGEMSLLTGAPRTATVIARADCSLVEISADAFRAYVQSKPDVLAQIAAAAAARLTELEAARASASLAPKDTTTTLLQKMRMFFRL
jgi:small-conductance mechanosensitive channel